MKNASESFCRACLYKSDLKNKAFNFKTAQNDFETFKLIYTDLTSLQVTDDDEFPKCFCPKCTDLLEQFKNFKDTCIKSDLSLRSNFCLDLKEELEDGIKVELPIEVIEEYENEGSDDDWTQDPAFEIDVPQKRAPAKYKRKRDNKSKETDEEESEAELSPKIRKRKTVTKGMGSIPCSFENCGKLLKTQASLALHQRIHDKSEVPSCHICSKKLSSVRSIRRHMKKHETKNNSAKASASDDDEFNVEPKKKKDSRTGIKYKLMHKCTFEGCGRLYRLESNLEAHMRIHEGGDANVCDICNKPLSSIRSMMRHKQTHEAVEERKDNACPVCNKVYTSRYSLKLHMRQHSETGRSFICEVCGVGFYSASILNNHKQTHNTTREYKCDICPKDFKSRNRLYNHKKDEHERTNMTYKCRICDKVLATKKSIWIHCKNVHTVYTTTENIFNCMQCDMKFKNIKILQRHQKLHTGERKFACPLCPKTFAHGSILKKHSYFHSGERPVHCEICNKGFYQKYALEIHMNIHKRKLIAEGVQGVTLYEYNRNKKKNEAAIHNMDEFMPVQSSMGHHSYGTEMMEMKEEGSILKFL